MAESDFLPFATGGGANVQDQADFAAAATTGTGFETGVADSADCNKVWRQSSFMAAAVANFMLQQLDIDISDDGNLSEATTNLTNAIKAAAGAVAGNPTLLFQYSLAPGNESAEVIDNEAWNQCFLNLSVYNTITGAALGTNQINTLPAGTYKHDCAKTWYFNGGTVGVKLRLRDVTNNVTLAVSGYAIDENTASVDSILPMAGVFTITEPVDVQLQAWFVLISEAGTMGGGTTAGSGSGENEIYGSVRLEQIAT